MKRMPNTSDIPTDILEGVDYFITGSVAFGTQHEKSDIDICVSVDKREALFDKVNEPVLSSYNNGFKFRHKGIDINIIPLHWLDFVSWFHARNLMQAVPFKYDRTRPELHGMHETFIGVMKTNLANKNVDSSNYLNFVDLSEPQDVADKNV